MSPKGRTFERGPDADAKACFRDLDEFVESGSGAREGPKGRFRAAAACAFALILVVAMAVVVLPRARAYGSTAMWQVAISGNCDNPDPAICGGGGGGIWVWAEFDAVGGNATVTGCGHTGGPVSGFAPPWGGAGHTNIEILSWTVGLDGTFHVTGETDTVVGHGAPITFTIPSEDFDTGIPAAAGHYAANPAPGATFIIQVVQLS